MFLVAQVRFLGKFGRWVGVVLGLLLSQEGVCARDEALILEQQRQRAREAQLAPPSPDVRLRQPESSSGDETGFPTETPCFTLDRIQLEGQAALPFWLRLQATADTAKGRCLGGEGINVLMRRLQNSLIDHGYVTTRVLAPPQDLSRGQLTLVVVPGRVQQLRLTPDSDPGLSLWSTFPARPDALLDLRDIEQGLENLQRLPTAEARMEIVPGDAPGQSDIDIHWQQTKGWRLGLSLDDAGSEATGRYQGGLTLSLDNPLSLADLFYLSLTEDLSGQKAKGSQNLTGHYSLPFRYWMLSVTASDYNYHQRVAGQNQDYTYSGESQNLSVQLSRLLHRGRRHKTSLSLDILTRQSSNAINDTDIQVQHRRTSAWHLGLQHRHSFRGATLDIGASYQAGTGWFGALPAPEESFGEATSHSHIVQLNAQLNVPFSLSRQPFAYSLAYVQQLSHTPLTPQDQFSIGSRWTVRGFDGERTLNANQGYFVRNTLTWQTPLPEHALYVGADYGEVGGHGEDQLVGTWLAGGVLGVQGSVLGLAYDVFVGLPFSKPAGFKTHPTTLGFSLNWQY